MTRKSFRSGARGGAQNSVRRLPLRVPPDVECCQFTEYDALGA
jgi:hypothetical protein